MQEKTVWLITAAGIVALGLTAVWQRFQDYDAENPPGLSVRGEVAQVGTPAPSSQPVRIEVLNGCGSPQAAALLTRRARHLGLDVVEEGNAENFAFLESMVIDRRGNMDRARRVAGKLGIPVCIQQISKDPSMLADVSVIIGHDHEQLGLLSP